MKVIIIGGVAGGASAAARLRRLDEQAEIIIFERSGYVSYANCGLPYYIGGVITDEAELTLKTPASFRSRFNVDVRVHHEVTAIDPAVKSVTVRDLESGRVFEESYDRLLLAPGAKPIVPPLPGIESRRVFTLRTVEDTLRIRRFIDERHPKSAVILGGGNIGIEAAENLRRLGMEVVIVERLPQLLRTLDSDMASLVHAEMRDNGVVLRLGSEAAGFEETDSGIRMLLKGGEALEADMVLLAVGVSPDAALARSAGLALGLRGSILVNDRMETSVPDIYAAGDAVQIKNAVSGQDALISLAGPANRQGRIAADNMAGFDSRYRGALGSSVTQIFRLTAACTGLTASAAADAGFDFERIVLSPQSHATYYPGAKSLTLKLVYEKQSLRLLGAQVVGYDGADKRLDVLATAIRAGFRADELGDLDLCYAPPYSSAKDPINLAGFMIENIATGKVRQVHWDELPSLPEGVTLLDTRTPSEYEAGHAEGFINLQLDELRGRLGELDRSKPVVVMCQTGLRSYIACRMLTQAGFDCRNFSGGYRFYAAVTKDMKPDESSYPCGQIKKNQKGS